MKERKYKILVVGYLPPPQEGTAKLTEILVESEYMKSNFDIEFLDLLKRKMGTDRGKFSSINITYNLFNILNFCRIIIIFSPDIVYMPLAQNKFGFLRDSIFIIIAKIFRKKICIHFHGGNFDLFYENQRHFFKTYIMFLLMRIERLIVLAKKFEKHFPYMEPKKLCFIYNCFPKTILLSETKDYSISPERKIKVLFVGYISKAKGALDLIKSVPFILDNYGEQIEFILCGQPIDIERNIVFIPEPHLGYSRCKEFIAQNSIGPYVKFYPETIGIEKDRLFLDADIFVLPTYSDGCALTVLEAMFFGLPVITTPVSALEEMFSDGEHCFFVNPGDVVGLSKKMLFLLNNPAVRQKMGEANRRLVREKYCPEIFLNNLSKVWNSI